MKKIEIEVPDWADEKTLISYIKKMSEDKESLIDDLSSLKKAKLSWGIQLTDDSFDPKNLKSLLALGKLMTIARRWNKIDGLEPDICDNKKIAVVSFFRLRKFAYKARFFACTDVPLAVNSNTEERAVQFGDWFNDLWNECLTGK